MGDVVVLNVMANIDHIHLRVGPVDHRLHGSYVMVGISEIGSKCDQRHRNRANIYVNLLTIRTLNEQATVIVSSFQKQTPLYW